MSEPARVYAIIPAAGKSRRMGRAKQLIDVSGRPLLRTVIETIAASNVVGAMVVTTRAIFEALGSLHIDPVHVAFNEDPSSEMIDSIRIGLRAWREQKWFNNAGGILICPGDLPELKTEDIQACISAFRAAPQSIVIASHAGHRGHPIVFSMELATFVESAACNGGLNALPKAHKERIVLVDRPTRGVTRDVDTPGDLHR